MQICIPQPIPDGLKVIETMRAEPDGEIRLWPLHLERLRRDCDIVRFPLDEGAVTSALGAVPQGQVQRVRLTVNSSGHVSVNYQPLGADALLWHVAISGVVLNSGDPWLRVKTTNRVPYDAARKALPDGCDEVILLNERGEVCEGSITTIFVRAKKRDKLLTPPLASGLLPGVLRQSLLNDGRAEEALLQPADLIWANFYCGNALRGLIPSRIQPRAGI